MRISPNEARAILHRIGVARGVDYYSLHSTEAAAISDAAIAHGYRLPRNANGSTGRYFHDHLQRLAAKAPPLRWSVGSGRWLWFDGQPAFSLHIHKHESVTPVQVDSMAHIICALFNASDVTLDTARPALTLWCDGELKAQS